MWVKFFDPGDGVTYTFRLSEDDAEELLALGALRRGKPITIASIGGQAHFDGEDLHLSYRNGSRGIGNVCTNYRAACRQLQERLAEFYDSDEDE